MPITRAPGARFIKDPRDVRLEDRVIRGDAEGDVGLLGVPWDGAVGGRPGARFAPSRVRGFLYSMPLNINASIVDFGDVDVVIGDHGETMRRTREAAAQALKRVKELLVIGGDNSVSHPVFQALNEMEEEVGYILIDAHPDIRTVTEGLTSGLAIRMIREANPSMPITVVGYRPHSNPRYLMDEARQLNVRIITMNEAEEVGVKGVAAQLAEAYRGRRVYLSLDMDAVDPAFAPGVNSPSPGGFTSREVIDLVSRLSKELRPRVFDVVEVTPLVDVADQTSNLAAAVLMNAMWPQGDAQ
ncbi:agmatinase [Thermocladium modestius]|uniref:Agmatinase n=1 Tax=Thermocladium modestius TaxID=62609 RepID=A0A830GVF5_9CREN|nr:arginase family protein [Thermocladium modestius]GGP19980.1 agmatinase [Thermocladium modestius]